MPRARWLVPLACVAMLAATVPSRAAAGGDAPRGRAWTLRVDDDFLALAGRDADYTGGVAYTLNDDEPVGPRWLARALDWIDGALRVPRAGAAAERDAVEIGFLVFTPAAHPSWPELSP